VPACTALLITRTRARPDRCLQLRRNSCPGPPQKASQPNGPAVAAMRRGRGEDGISFEHAKGRERRTRSTTGTVRAGGEDIPRWIQARPSGPRRRRRARDPCHGLGATTNQRWRAPCKNGLRARLGIGAYQNDGQDRRMRFVNVIATTLHLRGTAAVGGCIQVANNDTTKPAVNRTAPTTANVCIDSVALSVTLHASFVMK
jgi:hypothetical protein